MIIYRSVLFSCLIAAASGVTLRHGLDAGLGASLAAELDFARVVRIDVAGAGLGGSSGSGVLLNSEWVLTAGHVVNGANGGQISVSMNGMNLGVEGVVAHPGWAANPGIGLSQGSDLTLLKLSSPVANAPVVQLWQGGGGAPLIGVMAGYGNGGNGLLGAYLPGGTLQAGMNVIDRYLPSESGAFWVTDFDSGQTRHNSLNLATVDLRYIDIDGGFPSLSEVVFSEAGNESESGFAALPVAEDFFAGLGMVFPEGTTARGDSGGPLFIFSAERSRWELAGVTSFGVNPLYSAGFNRYDSRYGDLSFFADVSSQGAWINSVLIPEPSSSILVLLGLGMILRKRNRLH